MDHKSRIRPLYIAKMTVTKVTVFFQRCVPQVERDVSFGSDVRFAREVTLAEHITSLCGEAAKHHCK